jgi:hypothetical protein
MSHTYRVWCLSHDPALPADRNDDSYDDQSKAAKAGMDYHPVCTLAVVCSSGGAVSASLVDPNGDWVGWGSWRWIRILAAFVSDGHLAFEPPDGWTVVLAQRLVAAVDG